MARTCSYGQWKPSVAGKSETSRFFSMFFFFDASPGNVFQTISTNCNTEFGITRNTV